MGNSRLNSILGIDFFRVFRPKIPALFSILEIYTAPEFLNVYGAQESIPIHQFHQTM
jgi:hypothetical protein